MFTKNMLLFSVSLLAFTIAADNKLKGEFTNTNNKSIADLAKMDDKLLGGITKTDVQDFSAGFGIGLVQGFANKTYAPNDYPQWLAVRAITYTGATRLEAVYNNHKQELKLSTLWGRGIGQFVAENSEMNKSQMLKFNPTLAFAAALSAFQCLRESFANYKIK